MHEVDSLFRLTGYFRNMQMFGALEAWRGSLWSPPRCWSTPPSPPPASSCSGTSSSPLSLAWLPPTLWDPCCARFDYICPDSLPRLSVNNLHTLFFLGTSAAFADKYKSIIDQCSFKHCRNVVLAHLARMSGWLVPKTWHLPDFDLDCDPFGSNK